MLKQTLLTFKGAIGFFSSSAKREEDDNDSGISSRSELSGDEWAELKDYYTTTGILAPARQSINEITVARLTYK
jgi:hypothetical protein